MPRNERLAAKLSIPVDLDDLIQHVVVEYLRPAAENFSNPNIEFFLDCGDPDEARRRRLIEAMPPDSVVLDLVQQEMGFEDEAFLDFEDAAFCDADEIAGHATALAESVEAWFDKYEVDWYEANYQSAEGRTNWIKGQCIDFMTRWRSNVRAEFGR